MAPSQAQLDHVVLLLPYQDILHPPTWLTDHFVISEGGRHSDGKTENKLILFADGSYLELIAFVNDDPQHRANHWWDKPFGVVDYALTTTSDDGFGTLKDVRERLAKTNTGISYTEPQEGGRLKPDGTKLEWFVVAPFWNRKKKKKRNYDTLTPQCLDDHQESDLPHRDNTRERSLLVPRSDSSRTTGAHLRQQQQQQQQCHPSSMSGDWHPSSRT